VDVLLPSMDTMMRLYMVLFSFTRVRAFLPRAAALL
jgi:hypothetical protein